MNFANFDDQRKMWILRIVMKKKNVIFANFDDQRKMWILRILMIKKDLNFANFDDKERLEFCELCQNGFQKKFERIWKFFLKNQFPI